MAEFSYIARNSDGVRIEDSITASSLKDATELLLADNLSIVKISIIFLVVFSLFPSHPNNV